MRANLQPSKTPSILDKRPYTITLPIGRSLLALVGRTQTVVRDQLYRRFAPLILDSRVLEFSTLPWLMTIELPSAVAESDAYPIEYATICLRVLMRLTRLSATAPPASRATFSRSAPIWRSEEAHRVDTILNQPNCRRVSTDRLNRVNNQLVSSLEGESGLTPAVKSQRYCTVWYDMAITSSRLWINRVWLPILVLLVVNRRPIKCANPTLAICDLTEVRM